MAHSIEQLAENLRALRARRKLSQHEVAVGIGVTQAALSAWECGKQGMSLDKAAKVADFYGVSLDELVGRV